MIIDDRVLKEKLSKKLYGADNKYLSEQRALLRQAVASLKSLDKDLKSLTQFNDNAKNEVMGFNDKKLDEQQRTHTSSEASQEFINAKFAIEKMMSLSSNEPKV